MEYFRKEVNHMQLASSQHYLVKTSYGITYYFYLNKNKELLFRLYDENNQLIKTERLVAQIVTDFSVAIDNTDQIHLICITQEGDLLYYLTCNNHWNHKQVSKLDTRSNIYKYLLLFILEGRIHILCYRTNLTNPAITFIEHTVLTDKTINRTTVTSFLPGEYLSPYHADIDSMNNIHIIYKVFYKKNHQLYYSKFSAADKKWRFNEIITNLEEDHCHPSLLIDKKDNLHLAWCTIENNNFNLKYKNKPNVTYSKSRWSKVKTLSNKDANYLSPLLIQEGPLLKVLSIQNQYICEITSEDYGANWSSFSSSNFYKANNPLLIRYSSNYPSEKEHFSFQYVYGEIEKQIKIFGTKLLHFEKTNAVDFNPSTRKPAQLVSEDPEAINKEIIKNQNKLVHDENKNMGVQGPHENQFSNILTKEFNNDFNHLVQDVQNYVNRIVSEVEKLHKTKHDLESNLTTHIKKSLNLHSIDQFYDHLKNLKIQLSIMEEEKFQLQIEFDKLQKRMNSIEEIFVEYKKQYLILEEQVNEVYSANRGLINRIKSFFK